MDKKTNSRGPPRPSAHILQRRKILKEIKTKQVGGKPRTFDKSGVVPKTAMKKMWLHTKDKALSETIHTPFASQQEATGNAPANTAGDQMLSGAETTAKKGVEAAHVGGRKMIGPSRAGSLRPSPRPM